MPVTFEASQPKRVGQAAHRQGASGRQQAQDVALGRGQAALGGDRGNVRAGRQEELEHQLPGLAAKPV